MLVLVEMQITLRLLIFGAEHAIGRGKLRHDQPASAEITNESPENCISHAGHGCENRRRRDSNRAETDGGRHSNTCPDCLVRHASATLGATVLPELFHNVIFYLLGKEAWTVDQS